MASLGTAAARHENAAASHNNAIAHDPPGVWDAIVADFDAARIARGGRIAPFLFPSVFAVALFRLANAIGHRGLGPVAHALCLLVYILTGAEISWRAQIGHGLFLEHPAGVIISDEVVAGRGLRLGLGVLLGFTYGESSTRPRYGCPTLGDDVEVMAKASVIGPVSIGDRATIGAHALVMDDVPAEAVARGVPARSYRHGQPV